MEIKIDASDAKRTAAAMRRGPAIVNDELMLALQQSGADAVHRAKVFVPVVTGVLGRSITSEVTRAGGDLTVTVTASAPYARWVHDGRGPIEARPGGVLRFVIRGKVFYRKRVGPAKANPFLRKALRQARGDIKRNFSQFKVRVARRLASG